MIQKTDTTLARIGNDIGICWAIFQNIPGVEWRTPLDLEDIPISLELFNPLMGTLPVEDFTVEDNKIHWTFKGKNQTKLGKYTLTLVINPGRDNQHVVDRIDFLELVPHSNTSVLKHSRIHGCESILDIEAISIASVVDYSFETVAHAAQAYASLTALIDAKQDKIDADHKLDYALIENAPEKVNAYDSIENIEAGLYQVKYGYIDYEYAKAHIEDSYSTPGGCSALAIGAKVARTYDWYRNGNAVFVCGTPASEGRFAVLGLCGNISTLTRNVVETRQYREEYKILPFRLLDGVNSEDLFAEVNVVPAKGNTRTVPTVEKRETLCSSMLVRYILDHFSTVDEAVAYLRNYVEIYMSARLSDMGYEPHYMIKDSTKCVVLEFVNNAIVTVESNKSTNFHLNGVSLNQDGSVYTNADVAAGHLPTSQGIDSFGSGLERWNLLNSATDIEEAISAVLYSQTYTLLSDVWNSEFVGGTVTVDTPANNATLLARIAEYRQKYQQGAADIWETVHAARYDLTEKVLVVSVKERTATHTFEMNPNPGGVSKEYVDQAINILEQGKQDKIDDLAAIRSGAEAGATAYQKPGAGIPANDLASGVIPDVSGFITKTVNDLVNYYKKTETYTQTEIQALINAVQQFTYEVVASLPEASAATMHKIYLVPSTKQETRNVKDEYITIQNGSSYVWEQIGSTTVDLSAYSTTVQMNAAISAALTAALADYTTTAALTLLLAAKQDVISDLSTIRSGAEKGGSSVQKVNNALPDENGNVTVPAITGEDIEDVGPVEFPYLTISDVDNTVTSDSPNPVKSSGIYTYVQGIVGDIESTLNEIRGV